MMLTNTSFVILTNRKDLQSCVGLCYDLDADKRTKLYYSSNLHGKALIVLPAKSKDVSVVPSST